MHLHLLLPPDHASSLNHAFHFWLIDWLIGRTRHLLSHFLPMVPHCPSHLHYFLQIWDSSTWPHWECNKDYLPGCEETLVVLVPWVKKHHHHACLLLQWLCTCWLGDLKAESWFLLNSWEEEWLCTFCYISTSHMCYRFGTGSQLVFLWKEGVWGWGGRMITNQSPITLFSVSPYTPRMFAPWDSSQTLKVICGGYL